MLLKKPGARDRFSNREKSKLIISMCLLFILSLSSIYVSSYLHLLLSNQLESIKIFKLKEAINIIKSDKLSIYLFLILETGAILISIIYFLLNDRFYESKLIEITPKIKIPVPAGQMQFGSAKFLKEEEYENFFSITNINPKDNLIKYLLNAKENLSQDQELKSKDEIITLKFREEIEDEETSEMEIEKSKDNDEDKDNEIVEIENKYTIQDKTMMFLNKDDDLKEIEEFNKTVERIDKIIFEDKDERINNALNIINTLSEGERKEKAIQKLNLIKYDITRDIEDEKNKIINSERKRQADMLYKYLKKQENLIVLQYINNLKSSFEVLPDLTEKIELQNYKEILEIIKSDIDKLIEYDEYKELVELYNTYKYKMEDEEFKRLEKIEKELY